MTGTLDLITLTLPNCRAPIRGAPHKLHLGFQGTGILNLNISHLTLTPQSACHQRAPHKLVNKIPRPNNITLTLINRRAPTTRFTA